MLRTRLYSRCCIVTNYVLVLWHAQDKAVQSVMKVLMAYKSSDIDAAVKALDQTKQDVLMKYIYRGFELSSDGNGYGAQLLVWHDKVSCSHSASAVTSVYIKLSFCMSSKQCLSLCSPNRKKRESILTYDNQNWVHFIKP